MKRIPNLSPIPLAIALFGPALQAQTPAAPTSQIIPDAQATETLNTEPEGTTGVRIVRLSQAHGKVTMDRNTGLGFEAAFNNLPITQGAKLKTDEGAAEVEFEDGSTLRLTPNTRVDFPQLSRTPTGATLSTMNVLSGTVYVSLLKTKGNSFTLTSGDGRVVLRPGAHIRLEVKDPEIRLAVIKGNVDFTNTAGPQTVGKMTSLIFNTQTKASADLIAGIEDAPFDQWDQHEAEYRQNYARGNALKGSGSVYGLTDLNYYGQFVSLGGCGRVWRPYFVSAAWDPYAAGIWAWYPAAGYTWVSPYPWGWAPFHYGSWLQCAGGDWGWQPGGTWSGLRNTHHDRDYDHDGDHRRDQDHDGDHRRHHDQDPTHHPLPPRPIPAPGHVASLVPTTEKPLAFSRLNPSTNSFVIRNDSAGLGIPRGEFGKLNKLSESASQRGSVSLAVERTAPPDRLVGSAGPESNLARSPAGHSGTPTHAGYFNRPGAESTGNAPSNWHRGDETGGPTGANGTDTASARSSGGYNHGSHPDSPTAAAGHNGAGSSGGYSGGAHNGGGGGESRSAGGSYGGGGAGGGGSHSAPSAPAPSAPPPPSAPAPAPAPSAPAPASHK